MTICYSLCSQLLLGIQRIVFRTLCPALFYVTNTIISPDMMAVNPKLIHCSSLFLHQTCCGNSLEIPLKGALNEYPQSIYVFVEK